jgi:hypothetical protein
MDDYKKLSRVIKYLRGTINMPLCLEADSAKEPKWWVDASYGVHPDLKSHTGGMLSLGAGAIYGTSTRQKINTKSSTEAELVGVAEVLPQILWTQYFLHAQGYGEEPCTIYQDNKSAILLEENGRASSSKRTRHINVRYYFVTDRIKNGEIKIEYCPTEQMMADFFTKPLQGVLFTKFRDFIMNVDPSSTTVTEDQRSVLDEMSTCVTNTGANIDEDGFTLVTYQKKVSPKYATNNSVLRGKNNLKPLTKKGCLSDVRVTENRLFKRKKNVKFLLENH